MKTLTKHSLLSIALSAALLAAAPATVSAQGAVPAAAAKQKNLDLNIFPGIQHGYMMKTAPKVYDQKLYDFSMEKTFSILEKLK